ncbi:MAG: bifunctional demethylmenaquinone methyltransferase/2-methoxy-6-polyprenyl-1,4-benzoquinol methylase UbiE [Candidatus Melainabacteria bacterium]|nr:bifunctional demethylmenaquinone methyltransferase/2-methoxy-6-polyprenyl-1,4-benzoquinol methylase UbiE [Candidatus Melainabacteria bacterium]
MPSFQLPTQEEKHAYVHQQFERIAARYDLANDVISMGMHRMWKKLAVDVLIDGPTRGHKVDKQQRLSGKYLDVCCGTGDLAIKIAERLDAEGEVVGLDFSGNMLDVARQRANKAAPSLRAKMSFEQGDALHLPFDDDTFDGAIVSFGLRNLTKFDQGINEMTRVVKPGGIVVNLDLGRPEGLLFPPAFKLYFRHIVPIIGSVIQNDRKAYTYLPESKNTYLDPEGITGLFQTAGLEKVQHIKLSSGSVALHVGVVSE